MKYEINLNFVKCVWVNLPKMQCCESVCTCLDQVQGTSAFWWSIVSIPELPSPSIILPQLKGTLGVMQNPKPSYKP
jgi:hypothetical protein